MSNNDQELLTSASHNGKNSYYSYEKLLRSNSKRTNDINKEGSHRRHLWVDKGDFTPTYPVVIEGLKKMYSTKIRPLEERFKFDLFHSMPLRDSDFDALPMVLLLGQYSTGKTSFIEYLLDSPYPGERVGPEPTTDRFVAVMAGKEDRIIPGNALSMDSEKPFHALNRFGNGFLSKFEAAESPSPILKRFTLIDTPGVLSGEKQRIGRTYDFVSVCEWFAERSDLIILLFDCAKLDISDEFKRVINILRGHDDKIRVILNKSDQVSTQHLMRVYGALMWSLGKVVPTPEVMRVYIGSFWNQSFRNKENIKLFEAEEKDLLQDLMELPHNASVRKVNEFVKRTRLVRVHSHIIGYMRERLPIFGKDKKKQEWLNNMESVFQDVERIHKLPLGDFPDIRRFVHHFQDLNISECPKLTESNLKNIDEVLSTDIPKLMALISPSSNEAYKNNNPFKRSSGSDEWIVTSELKDEFDSKFYALKPQPYDIGDPNSRMFLTGNQVKKTLLDTGVPNEKLRIIWELADNNKDSRLDDEEFALALFLCSFVKNGNTLPQRLPNNFVPPSQRLGL